MDFAVFSRTRRLAQELTAFSIYDYSAHTVYCPDSTITGDEQEESPTERQSLSGKRPLPALPACPSAPVFRACPPSDIVAADTVHAAPSRDSAEKL